MVGSSDMEKVAKILALDSEQEPTADDFAAFGVPEFARVEIPLRDRYAFEEVAEALMELARRLSGLRHDSRFKTLEACSMAYSRVQQCNHTVKLKRLASRISTKSGR